MMRDKSTGRPIETLEERTAAIIEEWKRQGEDRRRWPLAPVGLAAIGLAEVFMVAEAQIATFRFRITELQDEITSGKAR